MKCKIVAGLVLIACLEQKYLCISRCEVLKSGILPLFYIARYVKNNEENEGILLNFSRWSTAAQQVFNVTSEVNFWSGNFYERNLKVT